MIQCNDQRYWLYAAIDPETNEFLHGRPVPTRTIVLTNQFLQELAENHDVVDSLFLVDGACGYKPRYHFYHTMIESAEP